MQAISTLFRFAFRLFLGLPQRHRLFKRLAHFIQSLVIQIMNTFGPFGIQVNQLVIVTHGLAYVMAWMPQ